MINFLWKSSDNIRHHRPLTLQIGEIDGYDFSDAAKYIFQVLQLLETCRLIISNPYKNYVEVLHNIHNLIGDIDINNDELQITERKHVRVEFRDELLVVEMFVGA